MIAGKMMDPVMGIDIHIIQPPGPVPPVPIPHPFIGMVVDPMDLAPIVGATVMVNSMPRATAGTGCKNIPPHIPIGGTFIKPPGNEGEIFMGSATVLADGSPLSFLALPVLSCSDVGMPPPPRPKKKGGAKSLALPTTVLMAIPVGMPVMVGGPPTIDMMAMAMKAGMAGLGKAFKKLKATKAMKKASDKLHDAAEAAMKKMKVPKNARNKVHKGICSVTGHPVDIASGKVFTDRVDFEIPGPIPFSWERTWFSTSIYEGPLGHGWHHSYDMGMVVDERAGYVAVKLSDGRNVVFPTLAVGEDTYDRQEKLSLFRDKTGYYVRDKERLLYRFGAPVDGIQALESVGNAAGFKIQFAYTPQGFLRQVTDSAGRIFSFDTDQDGRVTAIHAPHPDKAGETFPIMRYGYDAYGDMTQATDALGHSFQFDYANHLLVKETNRNGLSFYFEYDGIDSSAKCIHTWGDGGIYDHKLTYAGGITVVENSLGHKTTHFHDGAVVHKRVDAMGGEHLTRYNEFYEVIEEVDPLERSTRYEYDERGNQALKVFPDESTIQSQYEDDLLVSRVDQVGGTWRWEYDENGNLIKKTDCLMNSYLFHYSNGILTKIINPANDETSISYDDHGNASEVSLPDGSRHFYSRNNFGALSGFVENEIKQFSLSFNLLGKVERIQHSDGTVRSFAYDDEENLIREESGGTYRQWEYQGFNKLKSKSENGSKTTFFYNTEEQLFALKNSDDEKHMFELNPLGEIELEEGFDGVKCYYKRNLNGNVISIIKASGVETKLKYDVMGRVENISHSTGESQKYKYDLKGNLIYAKNDYTELSLIRDLKGNVIEEHQGQHKVFYKYNSNGARKEVNSSLGTKIIYNRNPTDEIVNVDVRNGFEVNASNLKTENLIWSSSFERDLFGKVVKRKLPGGIINSWQYDNSGRLYKNLTSLNNEEIEAQTYLWDKKNRLIQVLVKDQESILYEYNDEGGVTSAIYSDGQFDLRIKDSEGNVFESRQKKDRVYGPSGRLVQKGEVLYEYDDDGNLIKKKLPNGSIWSYYWNASGMLEKVVNPQKRTIQFEYDPLGRRISKINEGVKTRWIWNNNTPLHEWQETVKNINEEFVNFEEKKSIVIRKRHQSNSQVGLKHKIEKEAEFQTGVTTWIFLDGSFSPIAKISDNKAYSIISNHLGTPCSMYDSKGELIWSAKLNLYGKIRNLNGYETDCPFRFPGQYEDQETGLCYNRFRYYDSSSGTYISKDPIFILAKRKFGSYLYVNNPVTFSDVFGLIDPWDVQFSQDSISDTFADGPWAGRTLEEAIEETRDLGKLPPGLELNVMEINGGRDVVTLNNRTLYVAQQANLPNVNPNFVGPEGTNKLNKLLDGHAPLPLGEQPTVRCS